MKIIFLDIDGVLNGDNTEVVNGYVFVDEEKVKLLKHIVDETGAKIVLSSDWRYDWETKDEFFLCPALRHTLEKYDLEIMDTTPIFFNIGMYGREREIEDWLEDAKIYGNLDIENFVILEDYWYFEHFANNVVRTNENDGLTEADAEMAIEILNREIVEED